MLLFRADTKCHQAKLGGLGSVNKKTHLKSCCHPREKALVFSHLYSVASP